MTLSVMDDLEFTSYECVKCQRLKCDLKSAKLEIEELKKLLTTMKTKTRTLLQKFDGTQKVPFAWRRHKLYNIMEV